MMAKIRGEFHAEKLGGVVWLQAGPGQPGADWLQNARVFK